MLKNTGLYDNQTVGTIVLGYEPNWETGNAVRWRIWMPGYLPMGIAGIYTEWTDPRDGKEQYRFAMLTVNADGPGDCGLHRGPAHSVQVDLEVLDDFSDPGVSILLGLFQGLDRLGLRGLQAQRRQLFLHHWGSRSLVDRCADLLHQF